MVFVMITLPHSHALTLPRRRGVVLLAVLVVIVLLTLAAYQYSELMTAEYRAADSARRSAQARSLAESGVYYTAALLSSPDAVTNTLNGNPYDNATAFHGLEVPTAGSRFRGLFSVLALVDPDDTSGSSQPYRFGVTDECGRINLNALMKLDSSGRIAHDMLMKLPNMTEEIANAILDWIDKDDEARTNGAENQYYSALNPPYRCKNGPLDSLDELLLVRGVTVQLLYGNDRNRNGTLDSDENDGGAIDRGWSAYLTVYSRELNVNADGKARINVNKSDLKQLHDDLTDAVGEELATYIIAYRLYSQSNSAGGGSPGGGSPGGGGGGNTPGSSGNQPRSAASGNQTGAGPASNQPQGGAAGAPAGGAAAGAGAGQGAGRGAGGGATAGRSGGGSGGATPSQSRAPTRPLSFDMLDTSRRARPIGSLYELINPPDVSITNNQTTTTTTAVFAGNGQAMVRFTTTSQSSTQRYPSPLNDKSKLRELLPKLLDKATIMPEAEIPGRVNVNTAPRAVLAALPGLTDADVQSILSQRPSPSATEPPDAIFQTPAWLITEANLSAETLRTLERYITARTQVYRVQVVGYYEGGGPSARVEAVIDTNLGRPRIVYFRDLTELGKGFDLK